MTNHSPTTVKPESGEPDTSDEVSLEGLPCSTTDFFSISSRLRQYELVSGVLRLVPMVRGKHAKRAELLRFKANEAQDLCSYLVARTECYVSIPGGSRLRGDVVLGRPSSSSSSGEYEEDNPPKAVAEVTSPSNWFDDFSKVELYASAGVSEYIIVHVHDSFEPADGRFPFAIYRYTDPDVEKKKYMSEQQADELNTSYFGVVSVEEMKNPPDGEIIRRQNMRRLTETMEQLRTLVEGKKP